MSMSDVMDSKWDLHNSISELESLGIETAKLNELNDSYEVGNLVENLKQMSTKTTNRCLYSQIDSIKTD
jgi:hypothetical protein